MGQEYGMKMTEKEKTDLIAEIRAEEPPLVNEQNMLSTVTSWGISGGTLHNYAAANHPMNILQTHQANISKRLGWDSKIQPDQGGHE